MPDRGQRRDYYRLEAPATPDWVRLLNERGEVVDAIEGRILDVSATGLRLHMRDAVLLPGTRIAVRFRIGGQSFATRGRVVWSDVGEFSKTQLAGIRFDENEVLHERLVRAIFDEQRDQLRRRAPR